MAARGGAQRPNGATQGKICQFKLVLLGESAVGKSSLVLRFVKGQFHEYQESTIGGNNYFSQDQTGENVLLGSGLNWINCRVNIKTTMILLEYSSLRLTTKAVFLMLQLRLQWL